MISIYSKICYLNIKISFTREYNCKLYYILCIELINFHFVISYTMNVKERVLLLEKQKKEREEAEQSMKIAKSTQITKVLEDQPQIQNTQSQQQEKEQTNRENEVINTLNKMFNENHQIRHQIDGQLQKQNEMQTIIAQDSDEEIEKTDQIFVNQLISQVNEKELQSEDRIYVSMINNEFTTEIKKSQRQSMDLQQINIHDRSQSILKSNLILNKLNQLILVRDDNDYLQNIDKILYIQRFVRQKLEKEQKERIEKEQLHIEKMNRYRINVLNELIQTEIKYVADLEILNMIKNLSIEKFPNKEDDIKVMFHINEILQFNTEFLSELQKNNNLKDPNAILIKNIIPLLNGFIFYYEYCKAYNQTRKITIQYEAMPAYQQFLKDIKIQNLLKGLTLNDYNIKPVQRLPKYVLLFKDLLKHTMPSHPDYQNVKFCLETIEKINDKNNNEMDVYLKQAKLIELYQQFGSIQNLSVFKPNIFFIFEDICQIYTKKIKQRIIIYAFNNLLLFAKKNKVNALKYKLHIPITQQSYIKNMKDSLILKNSFEVVTRNESIIIVNGDQNTKQILKTKIENIINQQIELFQSKKDKKQEINYCVKVEMIGTQKNPKLNKNVTFYQINFTIDTVTIVCLIRFSQVKSLLQIVNKYDNKLKIPNITKSSSKNQKAIDERKLRIEQLLQIVFNSTQIIENNEYQKQVLEILKIDSKFYSLPEQKRLKPELFQSICKLKQNQVNSYLEILQELQQQTYNLKINKDDQQVKIGNEALQQPYCIEITLLTGQNLQVGFKKNTLTWFIKNAIANHINLKYFVDFKIFIVDTGGTIRVIEDDEKISTFLDKSKTGFLQVLKKMFKNGTKFQFIFRKYLYLPQKQEELEYRQDETRLKYLMFEIVFQAKNQIFPLSFLDFCLMTAFYSIATQQKIDKNLLKKTLPNTVIKQHSEKLWFDQIQKEVTFREKQLQEFLQKQQLQQQNQKNSTIQGLSSQLMIACFQTNILYGMQLFFVECTKETIQIFQQQEFGIKLSPHILIGLNYNGFHFIRPDNRVVLIKIDYGLISEIKSFVIEFTCKIKNYNLIFKTQTPYEIKHLILEYQELIKILNS
ncbi:unnamed protein product [Paramecium primaurelia]|uniref:DH domain-containing protein n=1 Tax=Paramecium primaurelia TaxID=5886 RepID=A0A8S1KU71_PARPR|nr:unnamed protein product [Paramecium primaurelia]